MGYQDNRTKNLLTGNPYSFIPVGNHTQNSTLNTAQQIILPAGCNALLVQCTGQNVRYTIDGTVPTSTKGFLLPKEVDPVILTAPTDDSVFTFIETAASAVLEMQAIRVGGW